LAQEKSIETYIRFFVFLFSPVTLSSFPQQQQQN